MSNGDSGASAQVARMPWRSSDAGLSFHVTTHRIVLIDDNNNTGNDGAVVIGGSIPLPLVETVRPTGGPSFRSPRSSYKIELHTHAWGVLTIVFRGGESGSYTDSSKHRDDALAAIRVSMQREAWKDRQRQAMKEALRTSNAIASKKVGVDAILTKNALRDRENAALVDIAFGSSSDVKKGGITAVMRRDKGSTKDDIDIFLREATELIKVIQKYSATIERERASASSGEGGDDATKKDTDRLFSVMDSMGIVSALSEKQSGSAYHKQLAKQLVDFLRHNNKLTKAGGMMTLTDVYCLFNRARATNMISPEDLLKAAELMKEMNLGMSKRSFSSGVMVIQADEFDDSIMGRKLSELALTSMNQLESSSSCGITVLDVCRALNTSALLANEQLLTAEQVGLLCRDSTIEGVRFFPNLFDSGDFSSVYLSSKSK
jgi:ESCRT-II complex subunit VPS36